MDGEAQTHRLSQPNTAFPARNKDVISIRPPWPHIYIYRSRRVYVSLLAVEVKYKPCEEVMPW